MIALTVVLILTNSQDGSHTDSIIEKVEKLGSTVIRLDTDKVSEGEHSLKWENGGKVILNTPKREYNLMDVDSVWLRRPKVFNFKVNDPEQRHLTENEFKALLDSIYAALADKHWLNTPQSIELAKLKAYQIKLAQDLGFLVPDSIITADPDLARRFCANRDVVFKPLADENISNGKDVLLIPTTLITDKHREKLDLIRNQYILLQEYITKRWELRITYIDNKIFVAKQIPTDPQNANHTVDWRLLQVNGNSRYEISAVPDTLENKICKLMRTLKLNFATLDFVVDPQGSYYFLEVNPNGQWFGYTDEIGMPVSSEIASFLINPEKKGGDIDGRERGCHAC